VKVTDCANPAQFKCDCSFGMSGKCVCDASAPTSPEACTTTEDFHCMSYNPPTSCKCVPGSPTSKDQCPNAVWNCEGGYQPPVGCECIATIAPPPPP